MSFKRPFFSGPAAATAINEPLIREQFAMMIRLIPVLYGLVAFADVGLFFIFENQSGGLLAQAGALALFVGCVSRMVYWSGLRKSGSLLETAQMARIMQHTLLLGPAIAFVFSAITSGLFVIESTSVSLMATLGVWAAAMTCSFCLFSVPAAAAWTLLAASIPTALAFLAAFAMRDDRSALIFSGLIGCISGLVLYMHAQFYRTFAEIVNSRSQQEELRRQTEIARREANRMACTDTLTGLANRRRLDQMLRQPALSPRRTRAAIVIDLDGFKPLNDMYGHGVGDQLLIEAGRRLSQAVGPDALVARLGGDEFAILIENGPDAEHALNKARVCVEAIEPPFLYMAISAEMRASAGVAFASSDEPGFARLLERADTALYVAKARGRGCAELFCDEMEEKARQRAILEQGLHRAVMEDGFDIHFQPIIELAGGEIVGFEALARWRHPTLGQVSPAVFIPIAEQIGLIEAITDQLLARAARIATQWPAPLRLAFNLSAAQLVKPSAGLRIMALLSEAGLPVDRFEAEATETAIMKDVNAARRTLEALKSAGAHVSLDDFGTGYSSFSQLRDLPLDKVKIDKSFIDRIDEDARVAQVVRGMVVMCAHLDLDCVAEGVERPEQLRALRALGCAEGQGYLIAQPASPEATAQLLARPWALSA